MKCMKGMIADVLEQTLLAKMDQQLDEVEVNVPRNHNGEFELVNIKEMSMVLRNTSSPYMLPECLSMISKDYTM